MRRRERLASSVEGMPRNLKKSRHFLFFAAVGLIFIIQLLFHSRVAIHQVQVPDPIQLGTFKSLGQSKATTFQSISSLHCENESDGPCCASWEKNLDNFWLHHADWEVSHEDSNSFCFSRIKNEEKADFYKRVYELQWIHKGKGCADSIQAFQSNAGYAASVNQIIYGFWSAYKEGAPFQITKHREQMEWMFAPKNESSWGYCPTKDMNCYYLPLSDCPAIVGAEQKYRAVRPSGREENKLFQWLRLYATRPKQHVRKKVYDFITKVQGMPPLPWDTNCTAMHVRRGDSGFVKFPWRRYAAVQEYIDKGEIGEGDTIVLLTDDASTIEEVEKYHATKYNWIYLKRERFRGTSGGFSKHIPSGDEALEVVTIMAEVKLASQCTKLVAGHSGFVTTITDAMDAIGTKYKKYSVQTRVKESDVKMDRNKDAKIRVEEMWKGIEALHENKA